MNSASTLACALILAAPAALAAPRVVADIPPIHSLAAQVMDGVGAPTLLTPTGASPHGYAMKPSDAETLEAADAVFWVGDALTPWLGRAIETLGGSAVSVKLIEAPGVVLLDYEEQAGFGDHDHHGHGAAKDDHDEDHHDGHEEHADHEDDEGHGREHDGEHDGEHGGEHDGHDDHHGHAELADPHIWLHPENAKAMLAQIAATLAEIDPENAAAYGANAERAQAEVDLAAATGREVLKSVEDRPFVVFHDAFAYFEAWSGMEAIGALAASDASKPGPARVQAARTAIIDQKVVCVFAEPQFPKKLINSIVEGSDAKTGTLDPLGADLAPGADLYAAVFLGVAQDMRACLER